MRPQRVNRVVQSWFNDLALDFTLNFWDTHVYELFKLQMTTI